MKIKVAYFEITNICNLNCRTCYNRSGLNKQRREIPAAQLRESIDILLPLGLQRVLISGGEPTLHAEFDDILDLINAYPQLSFGIVTNGTAHNQKLIDMLNATDRFTLQISLDGSCEEQNAKTRGAGNFEKAIDFAKQIHKSERKPLLKMVLSQNNIDDAEAFYRLAVSLGFIPEFAFIYKSGNSCDEWESKALTAQQKLKVLKTVNRLSEEFKIDALLPLCTDTCPYVKDAEEMSVCIKPDGSIQPCQTLYDGDYSLGNIFDFDPGKFEQSVNFFISLARQRTQHDFGCHKCMLRETCGRGCLAAAVNLCGDPFGDDGECPFRKLQFLGYDLKNSLTNAKTCGKIYAEE
jgi:radical SAM protein with 4Fe4S-binding SPASM domain